ncbi:hypothetical protein MASR1M8_15920 [Thermomonas brevis]
MTVVDAINCDDSDNSGYRTLAQLRQDVFDACGFTDITRRTGTRTRAQLRAQMKAMLGLADPIADAQPRTLADMRAQVHRMLGFAAMGTSYAPGMASLIADWLNEAQASLWRRLELDKGGASLPPRMVADTNLSTLDSTPIIDLAVGMGKAHYEQGDAKLYLDMAEKYLADYAARNPPGLDALLDAMLTQAHDATVRRAEGGEPGSISSDFVADTDIPAVDDYAILLMAVSLMKASTGAKDAGAHAEMFERYFAELERATPMNARQVVTAAIKSAQRQLYRRYDALRTERWYSWPLIADQSSYTISGNAEADTRRLDPLKVRWVGVSESGGFRALRSGIRPQLYGSGGLEKGPPERYEIRDCIHLFPTPSVTGGDLVVKGDFGLEPFEADNDRATIDDEAIFLHAVANVKSHYRHPDAPNYIAQMETHLRKLVAGSHGANRYVPRHESDYDRIYVKPRYVGPGAWE